MSRQSFGYCNQSQTIILLDIPTSIEDGQQLPYLLKSSAAPENPYLSTEPKGAKRDAAITALPFQDRAYHASVQKDITTALDELQSYLAAQGGSWYRDRPLFISQNDLMFPPLGASNRSNGSERIHPTAATVPVILSTTELHNKFPSLRVLHDVAVCNPGNMTSVVEIGDAGDFLIPPGSTFILSTLERGLPSFLSSCDTLLLTVAKKFDLVLMDPPWPNRSVRHSSAYRTRESQALDPFQQAVDVVMSHLLPQGLVAVWITNKPSVRASVLEIFQALSLSLREEWVWIKTTAHGEPVTQLDGVWRRPYEILLLFRKGHYPETPLRRVIAAVPDLHSRKPCLKALLEELLPSNYSAIELFARSLTAGWWSWGDEVLRFQHKSHWARFDQADRKSPS